MKSVFKYQLPKPGDAPLQILLPEHATVLTCGRQGSAFVMWALIDTENKHVRRKFLICGTGWDLPDKKLTWVGTIQDREFVWHIFEIFEGLT